MSECPLTRRETEIVSAFADGLFTKEVADRLRMTDNAVNSAFKIIRAKTGARNATGVVAKAIREGWIQ